MQVIALLERYVRATITGNRSNFVKAFLVYSSLDSSYTAVTIAEVTEEETEDVVFEDASKLLTLDLEETNTDDDITQVQYHHIIGVLHTHDQFDNKQRC